MFRWVNGKNPMRVRVRLPVCGRGRSCGTWSSSDFPVRLSLASIGALLARQGLTPQKPLQRAYQRSPEAIEKWQRETYPAIARKAKQDKADIYFWDESGFRADAVQGTTWGLKAHTPVVSVPSQRQGISAASAVNSKGAFWFSTYAGGLNGDLFVRLLAKMMRGRRSPLHLVLDGLPGAQDQGRKAVRGSVAEQGDFAFPAWLCTRPQSGRIGLEVTQSERATRDVRLAERRTTGRSGPRTVGRHSSAPNAGSIIL